MMFRQLFDKSTSTYTYLLADGGKAILIDPVKEQVERDASLIDELGLELVATVETHVHADHVTGAWDLKQRFGSEIIYSSTSGVDGADRVVGQDDVIPFGTRHLTTRLTPGHTSGCATFVLDDGSKAFTGDALLIRGSGRTDFQQGDAGQLFDSVWTQILSLGDDTELYPGHDYKGRTMTTVGEEKALNARLGGGKTREEFRQIMDNLGLAYPRFIDRALPANLALGREPSDDLDDPWALVTRTDAGAPRVSKEWVEAFHDKVHVVDVREPNEWASDLSPLPYAERVARGDVAEASQSWGKAEGIVTICRSAGRSDAAALELESLGFHRVASMTGGMLAWHARPVTGGSCG